jgi:hypothetical protein
MIFYRSIKSIIFLLLIQILISNCSKYEDGPFFSFLSAKQRLAREWKVEYAINLSTGVTHSADFEDWRLSFNKDGSFSYKVIYNLVETEYKGKWEILGKNQIKTNYTSNSLEIVEFYTILRLTKKELWLKNSSEEIHYYTD